MTDRIGQRVTITGGMREFIGRTGTIVGREDLGPTLYRVRLDEPVELPWDTVSDDLWEDRYPKRRR